MTRSESTAAIVIPARLGSRRFPRKVVARKTGKFLLEHVWEAVAGTAGVSRVIVATDSEEVLHAARSFGADARMTSVEHKSGTDRVAEIARGIEEEVVINVQGDEPLVRTEDLARLVETLSGAGSASMATLARPRDDAGDFQDPNVVKVVTDVRGRALYFSRASLPHGQPPLVADSWLQHIGVYGFKRDFLLTFTDLPAGELERRERLEQLRALENGYPIQVLLTEHAYSGIDTEEEYEEFVRLVSGEG